MKRGIEFIVGTLFALALASNPSNAQNKMTQLAVELQNRKYQVHGTSIGDTVDIELYNPSTNSTTRLQPEIYISKDDTAEGNLKMVYSFSVIFGNADSMQSKKTAIEFLNGFPFSYDNSKTPSENALTIDSKLSGTTSVEEPGINPDNTHDGAYPNPFNAGIQIRYTLSRPGNITIDVFDMLGRRVRSIVDGYKSSGTHVVGWDGHDDLNNDVASGVYFLRRVDSEGVSTSRINRVK